MTIYVKYQHAHCVNRVFMVALRRFSIAAAPNAQDFHSYAKILNNSSQKLQNQPLSNCKIRAVVLSTTSGFSEMLSIPSRTKNSANSG